MAAVSITSVFTRPNKDISWYHETFTPAYKEYVRENFRGLGKYGGQFHPVITESDDKLTVTITITFDNPEAATAWDSDPYLLEVFNGRGPYNDAHGIVMLSSETIIPRVNFSV